MNAPELTPDYLRGVLDTLDAALDAPEHPPVYMVARSGACELAGRSVARIIDAVYPADFPGTRPLMYLVVEDTVAPGKALEITDENLCRVIRDTYHGRMTFPEIGPVPGL